MKRFVLPWLVILFASIACFGLFLVELIVEEEINTASVSTTRTAFSVSGENPSDALQEFLRGRDIVCETTQYNNDEPVTKCSVVAKEKP